jgi:2-polyprenyl-6-methoxyphenol hydroxylase-like FAD-dependent oxidoreductase
MAEPDVIVVGASLAGSAAAMFLAREGARVTLVEKAPDPKHFKRVCGHFIQASAVATLRRTGLLDAMEAAGAVRSHTRIRTRYGWVTPPSETTLERSINLRREKLDPLVRRMAADTPGVELLLGRAARELVEEDGRIAGVELEAPDGTRTTVRAPLVIGADGRDSKVARLAGVRERKTPHARFSYGVYYEGPPPAGAPDGSIWLLDPAWAAAFPTDDGLTLYACMPTKDRLAEFKRDPGAALEEFIAALPDAPPIRESRAVSSPIGKLEMPNVARGPIAPGLALVGDAALAADPLWGVGCGWAFQTAEWLAEAVAPALRGEEALARGLRRRHRRGLAFHDRMITDYATGRRFSPPERLMYSVGTRDERVAEIMGAYGTRSISPLRMIATATPRALLVSARQRPRQLARRFSPKARTPSLKSSEAKQA